jgi:hypothetical protein
MTNPHILLDPPGLARELSVSDQERSDQIDRACYALSKDVHDSDWVVSALVAGDPHTYAQCRRSLALRLSLPFGVLFHWHVESEGKSACLVNLNCALKLQQELGPKFRLAALVQPTN